jgi:hypothetical protein
MITSHQKMSQMVVSASPDLSVLVVVGLVAAGAAFEEVAVSG